MPRRCVLGGCSNTNRDGFILHQWPKDSKAARNWTRFVKITRKWTQPTKWSHLCSAHFEDSCYETSDLATLCGYRKKLKPDAVPTLRTFVNTPLPTVCTDLLGVDREYSDLPEYIHNSQKIDGLGEHGDSEGLDLLASVAVDLSYAKEKENYAPVENFHPRHSSTPKHRKIGRRIAFEKRERSRILQEIELEEQSLNIPEIDQCLGSLGVQDYCRDDKEIQVKPEMNTKGTQLKLKKPKTVEMGIQCELLKPAPVSCDQSEETEEEMTDLDDEEEECVNYDDPDYVPNDHDLSFEDKVDEPENGHQEKNRFFLVHEDSLMELFNYCNRCHAECRSFIQRLRGSAITVLQTCIGCDRRHQWTSQPDIGDTPAGNLILSSAILFSGSSVAKALNLMNHMGVPTITSQTFYCHQRYYLQQAVLTVWDNEKQAIDLDLKARGGVVHVAGDGRADSPGHSANFGSYTLLETTVKKILHIELVSVTEVSSSNAMEKEGLVRAIGAVEERGLVIQEITTDRHTSIRKYLREKHPSIKHSLDIWHVAKGLGKKIDKLGKLKECKKVLSWKKSVTNHLYWVASSTGDANPDLMEAKWLSIVNHMQDIHVHDTLLFPKCLHLELTGANRRKKWMIPNQKDTEELVDLLTKKTLMKDTRMLSCGQQTSSLESFHSVLNHFAPKLLHFSYHGMKSRLILAALHYNENSERGQAVTHEGADRYRIEFPKFKRGDHTVRKIMNAPTYKYVDTLKLAVIEVASQRKQLPQLESPPLMTDKLTKPDKLEAIRKHRSRFNVAI